MTHRPGRRPAASLLAAGLLLLAGATFAADPPKALLDKGERLLAQGDTDGAVAVLERAATTGHHVAVELALVRAHMQAGGYERAVAAAAHVASEHADVPGAAGLHAWLLSIGGQREAAARVLEAALSLRPADPLLVLEQRSLAGSMPVATGLLLEVPHRMAPVGPAIDVAGDAGLEQVVASAVLMGDGRHALAPEIRPGGSLWVRDGLGRSTEAWIDPARVPTSAEGTVLCLARSLEPGLTISPGQAPFAGVPVVVVGFSSAAAIAAPAWPVLRQGFLGGPVQSASPMRRLDVDIGADAAGSVVFDVSGRWIGTVAARLHSGAVAMAPVTALPAAAAASQAQPRPRAATMSNLYERAMRTVVQVIERPGVSRRSPQDCAKPLQG